MKSKIEARVWAIFEASSLFRSDHLPPFATPERAPPPHDAPPVCLSVLRHGSIHQQRRGAGDAR